MCKSKKECSFKSLLQFKCARRLLCDKTGASRKTCSTLFLNCLSASSGDVLTAEALELRVYGLAFRNRGLAGLLFRNLIQITISGKPEYLLYVPSMVT